MASIMLNNPTQQMQDLNKHMQQAAQAIRNGNPEQLVRMKLQQNPQLAQRFQELMSRFPNHSPEQVLAILTKQYGIDMSKLF